LASEMPQPEKCEKEKGSQIRWNQAPGPLDGAFWDDGISEALTTG